MPGTVRLMNPAGHLTREEHEELKQSLRQVIITIAVVKIISIICYLGLYALVNIYSEGFWSALIRAMILMLIPFQIINGLLLFLGALEVKPAVLKVSAILCILVALFNTVLGVVGALYFFRIGDQVMHFVISAIFGLMAMCICSVLCHDVIVIFMFIELVKNPPPLQPHPERLAITYNP